MDGWGYMGYGELWKTPAGIAITILVIVVFWFLKWLFSPSDEDD